MSCPTRKIAAILVSDVVGYSRLAATDEELTLARLRALRSDLIATRFHNDLICAHRPCDVLQRPFAEIDEMRRELVAHTGGCSAFVLDG